MDTRTSELRRVMGFADLVLFCVITNFNVIWFVRAAEAGPAGITADIGVGNEWHICYAGITLSW